jgi:hypothetical protein
MKSYQFGRHLGNLRMSEAHVCTFLPLVGGSDSDTDGVQCQKVDTNFVN